VAKEDDGDVRFKSEIRNMTVSCMRDVSGHNYRNSSVIVYLVMGQIPRFTERDSSLLVLSYSSGAPTSKNNPPSQAVVIGLC